MRNPQHDVLFEPVDIGPVSQEPLLSGAPLYGTRLVAAQNGRSAEGMKAEGGWGVVCTEWCSIHPASDDLPHPNAALWHDDHIKIRH